LDKIGGRRGADFLFIVFFIVFFVLFVVFFVFFIFRLMIILKMVGDVYFLIKIGMIKNEIIQNIESIIQ
jgi:hypothetical protein